MLASYPKATYARSVFKDKKKAWGSCQGNKNTRWQWGRCSWLRHMSQRQHLTQLKGKGGVDVGSALSISTVSCEGREEGREEDVHFQHCSIDIWSKPRMYSERFHWSRVEQLAHSVPLCLGPSGCPQQAAHCPAQLEQPC